VALDPKLIKIGYPSIFGVGAFFVIDWANRAMVQRLAGLDELGIYSIGYNFGIGHGLMAEGAVGSAWPPYFMSFINRREEARVLFGNITKYFIFCLVAYRCCSLSRTACGCPDDSKTFHSAYT
jgi:O-antigen/teichoic acid export membrane protein